MCINSKIFDSITKDKHVEHFIRLIIHYTNPFGEKGTIFIDLNKKSKLSREPETHEVLHFYSKHIPKFSILTVNFKEMVAEKVAAAIGRNKPRDHYDIYQFIKRNIDIDLKLVEAKCKDSGDEFDIVKMFNQAKKLKRRWDEDMVSLLAEDIEFQEVMKTLAKHFNLKKEKDRKKPH